MLRAKKHYLFIIILFCCVDFPAQAQYNKQYFIYRGRQFLVDNKFAQAINNFNTLITADTMLYEAYFYRGIAKYNLNDFVGAQADFTKALSINPVFTTSYHYRAVTYGRLGKYDEALADLEEAVELRPGYSGLYFTRGNTYFLTQQFEKAIADFNLFLRYEPKVSDAYLNRGTAYLFLQDTTRALEDYNTAVLLSRFDPEVYVRRARIFALKDENGKAIADLNEAIRLDSTNAFAYFNRALVRYNEKDVNGALSDFGKVLEQDPDNALTYYNRALIRSQIGDYGNALLDYEKVIAINPDNVLVYYNRAAVYIELERYRAALDDYTRAIELYPDFANAYSNRAYVKSQLGLLAGAKRDHDIAQQKINEYKSKMNDSTFSAYADTSKQFNNLLALDAEFARKDFSDDMLQYRKVDVRLKPLFKLAIAPPPDIPFERQYFHPALEQFKRNNPLQLLSEIPGRGAVDLMKEDSIATAFLEKNKTAEAYFNRGITQFQLRYFNSALNYFNKAIELDPDNAFYYLNRSALQSEMIDFIASVENNVQVLALDNVSTMRARVQQDVKMYDYHEAIGDLNKAAMLMPDLAYIYYNLGNLRCLSDAIPEAIGNYTQAIQLYPFMGEAYYNRGLVHIYLREVEKGCMDISKAGELGVEEAYSVIKKYCSKN
ncbi:MAG: tetratricopeptide repeat protein [Prevotellaceae bacterium]|jgi:tetratricopeptide (TPR) repeat protein|nr:tetratricopeptide repeat protein [Prevotellaceae bacterium]